MDSTESVTSGDSNNISHLVLLEDLVSSEFLFESLLNEFNFISNRSSIDLDFHQMSFLLSVVGELTGVGVAKSSDNGAVLVDLSNVSGDVLGVVISMSVLGEGFLLALLSPSLVEPSDEVFREVSGPNGGESSESFGSVNVSDESDNVHGRSFEDGDGFDNFLFVESGSDSVHVSGDVGHSGFEGTEGGEVAGLASVILGERPNSSSVVSGSLSGQKS